MKKSPKTLSLLSLVLLLLGQASACNWAGRKFGPKDEGGMYLVIQVKADAAQLDQSVRQTMAVIERRCDELGLRCRMERQSADKSDRIVLRISDPKDPERVKSVLLSAGMEMRPVVSQPSPSPVQTYATRAEAEAVAGKDKDVLPYIERLKQEPEGERFIVLERTPIVTGLEVRDAQATNEMETQSSYSIFFDLTPAGAARLGEWSGANINRYMAVVLDKRVRSVAYIKGQIFDSGQINGRFTKEQAEDVALILKSGSFPAPVEALEEGVYKP